MFDPLGNLAPPGSAEKSENISLFDQFQDRATFRNRSEHDFKRWPGFNLFLKFQNLEILDIESPSAQEIWDFKLQNLKF